MKAKKSALEVVNGISEREQLALLKFTLNGLTTLTTKQSVATICANIIGERNVKVKQIVIEWEEGGSSVFHAGAMVNKVAELEAHLNQSRKDYSHLETKNELLEFNYKLQVETCEKLRVELQANSDADQKKINYWIEEHGRIKKNYDELCKQIKKLVI